MRATMSSLRFFQISSVMMLFISALSAAPAPAPLPNQGSAIDCINFGEGDVNKCFGNIFFHI